MLDSGSKDTEWGQRIYSSFRVVIVPRDIVIFFGEGLRIVDTKGPLKFFDVDSSPNNSKLKISVGRS